MQMKGHILVVDDDARLRDLLTEYLRGEGFEVTVAHDAADARIKLSYFIFDAMVLDVMMPNETGVAFARSLDEGAPPILFLTAMSDTQDRIAGLETGAQDYLTKPFEPRELVLRLGTILQRGKQLAQNNNIPKKVQFGEWQFDIDTVQLTSERGVEHLTTNESTCLCALAENIGDVIGRDVLLDAMVKADDDIPNARSVDVAITRLRKKLEKNSKRPHYIITVRGKGYKLQGIEI